MSAAQLLAERSSALGIDVPAHLVEPLLAYYGLLLRWNRKINLTSLANPAQSIDRLLLEPLAAATHLPTKCRLADLGSGGGSPAIPLALALDSPHLLMVESRTRKAAFLREAGRELEINTTVVAMRFEELRSQIELAGSADVVSMRAVRPDTSTLNIARWLSRRGGLLALFTSRPGASLLEPMGEGSTWNITPSAMLMTFHVEHS